MNARPLLLAAAFGCSEYELSPGTPDATLPLGECQAPEPAPYPADLDPTCAGEPIVGAFTPVVEWTWTDNPIHPGYQQIMSTAMVAQVTDDDGDGVVGDGDTPDVVFTAFTGSAYSSAGALVVVDGGSGLTHWSVLDAGGHQPYGAGGVAIADLEGDGLPELLVAAVGGLLCVDHTGAFRWFAPVSAGAYGMPAVADLDQDGLAEVVLGPSVVNHDGSVRWVGTAGSGGGYQASFAADLDNDGPMEIIAGNTVYEVDGTVRWTDALPDGTPALADLDLDGRPEIVRVYGGAVTASSADGATLWTFALTDGGGGPPTVADFDGDGLPEVGVASREVYRVIDGDGTQLWANTVQDFSSSVTGSSVFDFEGDGAAEVVYADEQTLWVYDGATGAVELAWDSHSSGTLLEYPIVVDVDADGSAEIVVPSNDYTFAGSRGITVIGDAADSWAPARPVWNQHAYHVTNVEDDGGVPVTAMPSWAVNNSFRAGNSETASGLAQPDFGVGPAEVCLDECDQDRVVAWLPVTNEGAVAGAPVTLALYRIGATGDTPIASYEAGQVQAGGSVWVPVTLDADDFGEGGVRVVVDDPAVGPTQKECDEADNAWVWEDFPCP